MPITLPPAFVERMKKQLGEQWNAFEGSLQEKSPVSIRLNPAKPTTQYNHLQQVAWCEWGRYFEERPSFAQDPLIFAGAYYVQEASSMFLHTILKEHLDLSENLNVLDLCAAPGGKSTLISSLLSEDSLLISNELVSKRVPPLLENLVRWGNAHHLVSQNASEDFGSIKEFFDAIVVDAPCSGEGMFRKERHALEQWSPQLVNGCAYTQKQILTEIIPSLKAEGLLVYSTCTYAPQEDEEIIQWLASLQDFEPIAVKVPENSGVTTVEVAYEGKKYYGYRFLPHLTKGEGFFITCLRKKSSQYKSGTLRQGKKGGKLEILPKKYLNIVQNWVKDADKYTFLLNNETLYAVSEVQHKNILALHSQLRIHLQGVEVGMFKNNKLIPAHHLAMSDMLPEEFPSFELNYEQAIAYLQKKDFVLDTQQHQDWAVVKYQNLPLGFIKVLPQRFNNHYPAELRLRKEF
jgi:16S rRNA C967 or C1407 C5-methylase (RsmB/RsmF family)/NOL1/NOP2/fmu family ribosome biogenesis protein